MDGAHLLSVSRVRAYLYVTYAEGVGRVDVEKLEHGA
jgi:hypothetical protein